MGQGQDPALEMSHWFAVHQDWSVILKLEQVSGTPGGLAKAWTAAHTPQSSDSVGQCVPRDYRLLKAKAYPGATGLNTLRPTTLVPLCGTGTLEPNPKGKV